MPPRKPGEIPRPSGSLRARAEEALHRTRTELAAMSADDVRSLAHELQVHQIELEMQNEELREAQVELAEARDRYSDLYEFAPVGYLTLDEEGVIQEANLTAATLLGRERRELTGAMFAKFLGRDSQDHWHFYRQAVLAEGTKLSADFELKAEGSGVQTVHVESIAFGPADARHCRTALLDITEQKKAEDALAQLNINLKASLTDRARELKDSVDRVKLLMAAVSHLGEGVVITSDHLDWPGPKIVFVNEAMCRITGYAAGELLGQTPRLLQGRDTDPAALKEIKERLSNGEPCLTELVNFRKDGTPYHAEVFITPLFDNQGRRTNFVSIHRDITERKTEREALRREHEFNETIIGTAQVIVLVLDPEGRVVRFNPYFEKLSGWTLEEARGRDWFTTFLPERVRNRIKALFKRAMAGTRTRGNINPIVTKDGEERVIEWYDAVLTDDAGNRTGLLGTGTDITARQRLEQEVINAAEEERQRLAHDLHDDLGSLLTGIKLGTEGLVAALAREESGHAGKARTAAQQVAEAVAKTRAIAGGLRPVGADPEDLMSALRGLGERVSATTGLRCRFDCPGPVLVGEPIRANHLYRIAQEAVNNAVKYSGGSEITISLRKRDGDIELKVEDNGGGFDQSVEHRRGLGVHIMRYRASAMNGALAIEPSAAGGTEVVCTVPAS